MEGTVCMKAEGRTAMCRKGNSVVLSTGGVGVDFGKMHLY